MSVKPHIEAVIFDMDGVLSDSEPLYYLALNTVLGRHGYSMTEEDVKAVLGTTVEYTWEWLKERFRLDGNLDCWIGEYDRVVVKVLREKVAPSPGLYDLMDELKARGLRLGLASSSQGNWVEAVLSTLKVMDRFQVVVSGEMVERGKPEPEIFLRAAAKLGVEPGRCLVIEDSPNGIKAGKRAGMRVIAVLTPYTRDLDLSQADCILESLQDFDYGILQG